MNAAVEDVNQLASCRTKGCCFGCYVELRPSILQTNVANHKKATTRNISSVVFVLFAVFEIFRRAVV
jgi:hypothetical protein